MPARIPWTLARIAEQAVRRASYAAVEDETGVTTFAELWRDAGRVAAYLRSLGLGAGDGDVVAIAAQRGAPFVTGALGAWRAGAAYVPLDMLNPTLRLRGIVDDAKPAVLLSSAPYEGIGSELGAPEFAIFAAEGDGDVDLPRSDGDPAAYVMYTSGTTGKPKGVVVGHASLANLAQWYLPTYGITTADRALHATGLGFDVSVFELWPYLAAGVTVVTCRDEHRLLVDAVADQLVRDRCTTVFLPTPLAEAAMAHGIKAEGFRYLVTGGSQLRLPVPAPSDYLVVNAYGPTEATVFTTVHDVTSGEPGDRVPIGRPVGNVTVELCDSDGAEVPAGEQGELLISGAALAHGYLHNPELTAERFVSRAGRTSRWYRTGDLATWERDLLRFHGRMNQDQLKVNGARVEAGELEAALLAVDGIAGAAVVMADEAGRPQLVAVLAPNGDQPSPRALRRQLAARLPTYLIPERYVFVDRLPLTANGKLDRSAVARLVRSDAV